MLSCLKIPLIEMIIGYIFQSIIQDRVVPASSAFFFLLPFFFSSSIFRDRPTRQYVKAITQMYLNKRMTVRNDLILEFFRLYYNFASGIRLLMLTKEKVDEKQAIEADNAPPRC